MHTLPGCSGATACVLAYVCVCVHAFAKTPSSGVFQKCTDFFSRRMKSIAQQQGPAEPEEEKPSTLLTRVVYLHRWSPLPAMPPLLGHFVPKTDQGAGAPAHSSGACPKGGRHPARTTKVLISCVRMRTLE